MEGESGGGGGEGSAGGNGEGVRDGGEMMRKGDVG